MNMTKNSTLSWASNSAATFAEASISDLIDRQQIQVLFDSYCDAIGIASAIIDLEGEVFVTSRWQRLCTNFHRKTPRTCARCMESGTVRSRLLSAGASCAIYTCKNGLNDAASPLIINGRHIANVFIGQFFLDRPEMDFFRQQARELGFDECEYLQAVKQVPVIEKERIPAILRFMINCADIIARIGMERAQLKHQMEVLRLSELRFRKFFDQLPLPLLSVSLEGKVMGYNSSFLDEIGYELTSIEEWWVRAHPDPKQRAQIMKQWSQVVADAKASGKPMAPAEYQVLCHDHICRTMIGSGVIVGEEVLIIFFDVTALRQAEQKLKQYRDKLEHLVEQRTDMLQSALDAAQAGAFIWDIENDRLIWDERCLEIFSTTGKEFGGNYVAWAALVHPDDRDKVLEMIAKALDDSMCQSVKMEYRTRGEKCGPLMVRILARITRNEQGVAVVLQGLHLDITEEKRREKELNMAKERAELANAAKSEFLANMSHGIRTPIHAVLGFAQILRGKVYDPQAQHYVEAIYNAGNALLNLMNDVLDFSRLETQREHVTERAVNMRGFADEMQTLFERRDGVGRVSFRAIVQENVPPELLLDQGLLRKVMVHLIDNAFDFTEQGFVELSIGFEVASGQDAHGALNIAVKDSGIGISENKQMRLFEPFGQVLGAQQRTGLGLGLGLAVSKRFVELMGGSLTVQSTLGEGSVFRVDLPHVTIADENDSARGMLGKNRSDKV